MLYTGLMSKWIQAPEPYEMFEISENRNFEGPGVYITYRQGWRGQSVLYVGMASCLRSRLGDHRRAGMLSVIANGYLCSTDSTEAAARLERALIWLENPSENEVRPTPSVSLWAATLGQSRPIP